MGKFLDYYCPFCGKEFSLFYENSICQNYSSAFYERYDYLPVRKIKRKTRSSHKNGDLMEDIIPVVKAGNVLNFKKQTSPNPHLNNDEKNIIVYFKHEAENISVYFAERGLQCVFSENMSKRKPAEFLRNLLKPDLKLFIPIFFWKKNINKILQITDNVQVVAVKEFFLKLLKFNSKLFYHFLNDFIYMKGLKRIFFEVASQFKPGKKIHLIIPGNYIELLLARGKAFQELKLLSIVKTRNFILHSYTEKYQMGPV